MPPHFHVPSHTDTYMRVILAIQSLSRILWVGVCVCACVRVCVCVCVCVLKVGIVIFITKSHHYAFAGSYKVLHLNTFFKNFHSIKTRRKKVIFVFVCAQTHTDACACTHTHTHTHMKAKEKSLIGREIFSSLYLIQGIRVKYLCLCLSAFTFCQAGQYA